MREIGGKKCFRNKKDNNFYGVYGGNGNGLGKWIFLVQIEKERPTTTINCL